MAAEDLISEERQVDKFTILRLDGMGRVSLKKGDKQKIDIKTSPKLLPRILTEVENEELIIRLKKGLFSFGVPKDAPIEIHVTVEDIHCIKLTSGGTIEGEEALNVEELDILNSGSGDIQLELKCVDIKTRLGGSGNIILSGSAKSNKLYNAGEGNIDALNMVTESASIRATENGDSLLHVLNDLDVRITGTGMVKYKGKPIVKSTTTSAGKLQAIENSDQH